MKTTVYVHADSDMMAQLGEGLGLNENARGQFRHALGEIKVDLDVNEETGVGTIVKIDDRDVAPAQDIYPAGTIKDKHTENLEDQIQTFISISNALSMYIRSDIFGKSGNARLNDDIQRLYDHQCAVEDYLSPKPKEVIHEA